MARHRYLLAAGSNRRHHRLGNPGQVLANAPIELAKCGVMMVKSGILIFSDPVGPSRRQYANAAGIFETELEPEELLELLKRLEREIGRRPGGQRWCARVIDMDIILWEGGTYCSQKLTVPHPRFRERSFVLCPACVAAPGWRDPITGLTIRQLNARLTGLRPLPRGARVSRARWTGP